MKMYLGIFFFKHKEIFILDNLSVDKISNHNAIYEKIILMVNVLLILKL